MKIALHAAVALTNARLKRSLRVISIRLTRICALTVVFVRMSARLKQSTQHNLQGQEGSPK